MWHHCYRVCSPYTSSCHHTELLRHTQARRSCQVIGETHHDQNDLWDIHWMTWALLTERQVLEVVPVSASMSSAEVTEVVPLSALKTSAWHWDNWILFNHLPSGTHQDKTVKVNPWCAELIFQETKNNNHDNCILYHSLTVRWCKWLKSDTVEDKCPLP